MINNPDSQGCYEVLLGYKDIECSNERLVSLIEPLQTRASSGKLLGELGYPVPDGRIASVENLRTMQSINVSNACIQILDLEIKQDYTHNDRTFKQIIVGKVKPIGRDKEKLLAAFEDPNVDPTFGCRAVADNRLADGKVIKDINQIITWDYIGNRSELDVAHSREARMTGIRDISGKVKIGK